MPYITFFNWNVFHLECDYPNNDCEIFFHTISEFALSLQIYRNILDAIIYVKIWLLRQYDMNTQIFIQMNSIFDQI